jgi:hypothetical protein
MSDIVLSPGVRSNLLQLQQTSDLITQTQTRLATGKRVNSALDNPINFFTAQGLSVRANDLNALLDRCRRALHHQAVTRHYRSPTVQSAQALVSQANQTADTARPPAPGGPIQRAAAANRPARRRLGFNGINLLGGNDLTVADEDASSVVVGSYDDTARAIWQSTPP